VETDFRRSVKFNATCSAIYFPSPSASPFVCSLGKRNWTYITVEHVTVEPDTQGTLVR